MKKIVLATLAAITLAGCGVAPSPMASQTQASSFQAAGERQGLFTRLEGLVSVPEHWDQPAVTFEFGTKGLIFSDAIRKQPFITLNGKEYDADGYEIIAAEDGVLYVGRQDKKDGYYVLGTWEKPATLKVGMFRQKVKITLPKHTFEVKRPLNPMSHITFKLDLKAPLKVAGKQPQRFLVKK